LLSLIKSQKNRFIILWYSKDEGKLIIFQKRPHQLRHLPIQLIIS